MPVPKGLDFDMYLGPAPAKPYNPGRLAWPDWYLIWDYCVGFIVNWGVHHLDIAHWGCPAISKEPFTIKAEATYRNEGFTDNVSSWKAEYIFQSGLKMTFTDEFGGNELGCRFEGDEGWVRVDRGILNVHKESMRRLKLKPDDQHLPQSKNHAGNFLEAVLARKDPIAPVEAGHVASYLGIVPDISARLNRVLKWDPQKELFVGDTEANQMLSRPMRAPWKL
jgi:predicted dehydrogenase